MFTPLTKKAAQALSSYSAPKAVLCASQSLSDANWILFSSPSPPPSTLHFLTEKQETSAPAALLRPQLPTLKPKGRPGFLSSHRVPSLNNGRRSHASCYCWDYSVLLQGKDRDWLTWSRGSIWLASSWLSLFFKVRAHWGVWQSEEILKGRGHHQGYKNIRISNLSLLQLLRYSSEKEEQKWSLLLFSAREK